MTLANFGTQCALVIVAVTKPFALLLFPGLEQFAWFTALPVAIMAVLLIVTAVQMIRFVRNGNLAAAFSKMPERDAMFLIIGAALISGCFFAGHSGNWRGVHLIFVVAGLVAMRRAADARATRATHARALTIIVFLMWEELFRQALPHDEVAGLGPARLAPFGLLWLIREVFWWRLAALLLGVLAIFSLRSELFAAGRRYRGQSHLRR
jgi:hypothetical protein